MTTESSYSKALKLNSNGLKLTGINFRRNKQVILNNIDFSMGNEQFILMTGENGSGKSTLLKIIAGLIKPNSFELSTNNSNIIDHWSKVKKILRQKFCYLHQTPYLFSGTVFDNIAYGLKYKGLSQKIIKEKVEDALNSIGLYHLKSRNSHALSGGEKQRIAIARSWVIEPEFILLDEPFANMDKHSRNSTYSIINQLKMDNIGIILTSHDPHHGELNFNRHLHLHEGGMVEKELHVTQVSRV